MKEVNKSGRYYVGYFGTIIDRDGINHHGEIHAIFECRDCLLIVLKSNCDYCNDHKFIQI